MAEKIDLVSNFINADSIRTKQVKYLSSFDKLLIAKEVIAMMFNFKQNQIQDEPKESIWKEQQSQLYKALSLMDCEEESWRK